MIKNDNYATLLTKAADCRIDRFAHFAMQSYKIFPKLQNIAEKKSPDCSIKFANGRDFVIFLPH